MVKPVITFGAAVVFVALSVKCGVAGDVAYTGIFGFLGGAHFSLAIAILTKHLRG
jgi:hypothetical protein